EIATGVALAREAGIESACFFLMGFPGETDVDREKTLAFAKGVNPDYASFHIASPYPGPQLFHQGSWTELYPETGYAPTELKQLRRWQKRAYWQYYLRPGYVWSAIARHGVRQNVKRARLLWLMS